MTHLQKDDSTMRVRAKGDFRNLSWGVWKDHATHTRLDVIGANVLLSSFDAGEVDGLQFRAEGRYAFDEDVAFQACKQDGYIVGGTYDDGASPSASIKMNNGTHYDATHVDYVTLSATGSSSCVDMPSSNWEIYVKCGTLHELGCSSSTLNVPYPGFASCSSPPVISDDTCADSTSCTEGY